MALNVNSPEQRDVRGGVSLEAFIASNWQILTIFGVIAGITNYMSNVENTMLVTVGFLLTFIVELEILLLLIKTKNKSFLLNVFTLLSLVFIIIFAGVIYMNNLAEMFSDFGLAVYPVVSANKIIITRIILLIPVGVIILGIYKHIHQIASSISQILGSRNKRFFIGLFSAMIIITLMVGLVSLFTSNTEDTPVNATTTTSTIEPDTNSTIEPDTNSTIEPTTSSTTTLSSPIACYTNKDCGNQTLTRICYRGNVYLQKNTPSCQKPGTPESKCNYKTGFEGGSITTEPNPVERCPKRCENGQCLD